MLCNKLQTVRSALCRFGPHAAKVKLAAQYLIIGCLARVGDLDVLIKTIHIRLENADPSTAYLLTGLAVSIAGHWKTLRIWEEGDVE